jgi:rfaE bifunctional protein nucleotidyltransferase chain/domain
MHSKILSANRLKDILKRRRDKKVVFTNGCFDILHIGHIRYLRAAKSKGDILVVGLNADESVRRLKGPTRPITPQKERAQILAALEAIDYIVIFNEETPERLIRLIQPDILVKGSDWPLNKIVGADIVHARHGRVLTIPYVKSRSTTNLIKKIKQWG